MQLPQHLIEQLIYTVNRSPFYKKLSKNCLIPIDTIQTLEAFEKIPYTTKEQLAINNESFLCVNKDDIVEIVTTSGTTGDPIPFYLTNNDILRLTNNEYNSLKTTGVTNKDIVLLTTTSDKLFIAGLAYQLGVRKIGASLLRLGPTNSELFLQHINKFNPTVIIAVPSLIVRLIEFINNKSFDLNATTVKKIICIGEPIRNEDFTLNTLGLKIKSHWNVDLYSTYASTEMCASFTECNYFQGGHLNEDLIFAEIIDDNGNKVQEGELGELVITTIGTESMPLIRFKTGDICRAYYKKCQCGNKSMRLGPIIGRKNQMIKFKGTTLYPSSFKNILNEISEINAYYIEIYTNELNLDCVRIHVSFINELQIEQSIKKIKEKIKNKIRVTPEITISTLQNIQKIITGNNRKIIDVIDNRINN